MSTEKRPSHEQHQHTPEEHSFDELARGLADGTMSRRRALKLVGAAILGSALPAFLLPGTAEARHRRHRHRHRHGGAGGGGPRCPSDTGCFEQCTNTNSVCSCVKTTEGVRVCVHPCCPPAERNGVSTNCNSSSSNHCRSGEVCMQTDCCNSGNAEGVCVKLCTADTPPEPAWTCAPGATTAAADSTGGTTPPSGATWNAAVS